MLIAVGIVAAFKGEEQGCLVHHRQWNMQGEDRGSLVQYRKKFLFDSNDIRGNSMEYNIRRKVQGNYTEYNLRRKIQEIPPQPR